MGVNYNKMVLWPLVAGVLLACVATLGQDLTECVIPARRLPKEIRPVDYQLTLAFNMETLKCEGHVKIGVIVHEYVNWAYNAGVSIHDFSSRRNVILLHASHHMTVSDVKFDGKTVAGACRDRATNLIKITLATSLGMGSSGFLELTFSNHIGDDETYGLRRSPYLRANQQKFALFTHFQPDLARTAFPCFDEPEFKATFAITIIHNLQLTALSNMPVYSRKHNHRTNNVRTRFERTPSMSTYLVSIAVGEFEHIEKTLLGDSLTIGVYTPLGEGQAELMLHYAARVFEEMTDWFGMGQPLRKIDFVAVHNYKTDSAFEGWGLIPIERDAAFNPTHVDPKYSYPSVVIYAHALSHFWLGNLVTMKWWDDLWLNEAFGTFMGFMIADKILPNEDGRIYFMTKCKLHMLDLDPEYDAQLVRFDENQVNLASLQNLFTHSVYFKGAAVIKMIYDFLGAYLGEENFKTGIRHYINSHQYSNADFNDLCKALKVTTGLDLNSFISSWVDQPGKPEVMVSSYQGNQLRLTQKGSIITPSQVEPVWVIPMKILVSDGADRKLYINFILSLQTDYVSLPDWFDLSNENHFVVVNSDFEGFYVTLYDTDLLTRLEMPVRWANILSVADRLSIISNMNTLKRRPSFGLIRLISMISWFENETNGGVIIGLCNLIESLGQHGKVHTVVQTLAKMYHRQGGFNMEPSSDLLTRDAKGKLIYTLINVNYWRAIHDGTRIFLSIQDSSKPPISDSYFLKLVLIAAIRGVPLDRVGDVCTYIRHSVGGQTSQSFLEDYLAGCDEDRRRICLESSSFG